MRSVLMVVSRYVVNKYMNAWYLMTTEAWTSYGLVVKWYFILKDLIN